jgi:putative transposase
MARLPRLCVAGETHLVIQRVRGAEPALGEGLDRDAYLACLREAWMTAGVAVHAYAVMPTQVRLLATPAVDTALGTMLQAAGRRFVPAYNRRHGRRGPLWSGRFHATVIEAGLLYVECLRFVETAPVQLGLVERAELWSWSSAAQHAGLGSVPGLNEHRCHWSLGNTPFEREAQYRRLLEVSLSPERQCEIERSALQGWALGSPEFVAAIGPLAKRRLQRLRPGRPAVRTRSGDQD